MFSWFGHRKIYGPNGAISICRDHLRLNDGKIKKKDKKKKNEYANERRGKEEAFGETCEDSKHKGGFSVKWKSGQEETTPISVERTWQTHTIKLPRVPEYYVLL